MRLVESIWLRYLGWQLRYATRTMLTSLDDRMLRNVGLQSCKAVSVIREIEQLLVRLKFRI